MAFLTKKEFAERCYTTTNDLATFRRRGKVVLSGEFYDDTNEKNIAFMEYRQKFKPEGVQELPPPTIAPTEIKTERPNIQAPAQGKVSQALLEREKLELGNDKLKKETEKLKIQIEKLNGILIPTELTKSVIIHLSRSFSTANKQAADGYLTEFSAVRALSSKETSELRGKIVAITNKALTDALEDCKKMIKNIVEEYTEVRTKGERK